MKDLSDVASPSEQRPSNANGWSADFIEKFGSASFHSKEETLSSKELISNNAFDDYSSQTASQILWSTGMLSEPIPDGFYSVIHVRTDTKLLLFIQILIDLNILL